MTGCSPMRLSPRAARAACTAQRHVADLSPPERTYTTAPLRPWLSAGCVPTRPCAPSTGRRRGRMRPGREPAQTMNDHLDEERLRRLIDVGRSLLSQLDPDAVLDEVLDSARAITGARHAALGILDRDRRDIERVVVRGIDAESQSAIGDLPRGRDILGVLIDRPEPLRL